jgi:hypothetical protein
MFPRVVPQGIPHIFLQTPPRRLCVQDFRVHFIREKERRRWLDSRFGLIISFCSWGWCGSWLK